MSETPSSFAIRARYVFPVESPPLRDAVVAINDGRILAVGQDNDLASQPPRDLGNVAVLPGLVNAHTHLEFSDLDGPLGEPGMPFADWIRLVVDYRQERAQRDGPAATARALEVGLAESRAAGTTLLGEIATTDWPPTTAAIDGTVFRELIGLSDESVAPLLGSVDRHLQQAQIANWLPGISPHAPYSVRPDLIQKVAGISADRSFPVAMHLAETMEELELLRSHCGPLVERFAEAGFWDASAVPRGIEPLDYLQMLSGAHRCLVIHGNFLTPQEMQFLGQRSERMSVVFCPRTHAYFGHASYPLSEMLAAGVNVALGTDSRASNPDLNVLEELRFVARQHPRVSPETVLQLATTNGARALGRDHETGSIAAGKQANLTLVNLPDHDVDDPYELIFDSPLPVSGVIHRGIEITAGSC